MGTRVSMHQVLQFSNFLHCEMIINFFFTISPKSKHIVRVYLMVAKEEATCTTIAHFGLLHGVCMAFFYFKTHGTCMASCLRHGACVASCLGHDACVASCLGRDACVASCLGHGTYTFFNTSHLNLIFFFHFYTIDILDFYTNALYIPCYNCTLWFYSLYRMFWPYLVNSLCVKCII